MTAAIEEIAINPLKIKSSRIGLGTWAIGGAMWGGSDEALSLKTIHAALDHGINFIDTAPVYGFGTAESIVGKAISQHGNRDKLIIATKAGLEWQDKKISRNSSPTRIRNEVQQSLQRLKTDYIDIYQIHWPDSNTAMEKTATTMLDLLKEGKIRAIGVSNFSTAQMEEFLKYAPIHTSQPPYNLFERGIEKDILPFTEKKNIVTLAYGAICRGLLSGKMQVNTIFKGDDIRRSDPKFKEPHFSSYLNAVDALNKFAEHNYGKTVLALAVRWILDRGRTIALWGARHPKQLEGLEDVLNWNISAEDMQKIDAILAEHIKENVGPEFMAPPVSADKLSA